MRQQTEPLGHAVRQMYLLAAMIDVAQELDDADLRARAEALWTRIVEAHLYVTGGVGAEPWGEKFGEPYDLPPDRAYAETCAGIGVMMAARRLLNFGARGEVADVMERALYNNVLAGLALDGRHYFYVNPLEIIPAVARRRHDCRLVKPSRVPWFGCACCPPNIARTLAAIGHYLASRDDDTVWLHLYAGAELRWEQAGSAVRLQIATDYPWDGKVSLTVTTAGAPTSFKLGLRMPGWCRRPELRVNGEPVGLGDVVKDGYALIERSWGNGDRVELDLPMTVERVRADPRVATVAGRVALQRGPLVYAVEEVDAGAGLAGLVLPPAAALEARYDATLLGGVVVIEGTVRRRVGTGALYGTDEPSFESMAFRAVPYAWWNNRGEGEMRVWINES